MFSWVVVRVDMDGSALQAEGPFLTEEAASEYALRSFWLGEEPLTKGKGVSPYSFDVVPWTIKNPEGYWHE